LNYVPAERSENLNLDIGRQVSVWSSPGADYPEIGPFSPHEDYPERPSSVTGTTPNPVYDAVRNCLRLTGLDKVNYGTRLWNPLQELIRPGETVLLKPNFVKEYHPRDPNGWRYVVTHGSVIRAISDYVWKALEGKGKVRVADAPQTDSSFRALSEVLQLDAIRDFYRGLGLDFDFVDLRKEEWENQGDVIVSRRSLAGDPEGYVKCDLADSSEFVDHQGSGRYYGADYDDGEVNRHHSGGRHEYLLSGSAIKADVVVSIPKLKTHKKAGITVSLKNLVGINGDKNWLPHHTEAGKSFRGDESPDYGWKHMIERRAVRRLRALSLSLPGLGPWLHQQARRTGKQIFGDTEEVIRSGNWWGNDTTWRMCLDLNKILLYGNPDGTLREPVASARKRHFVLVDGIIAGQGRGPMNPDPVPAGVIAFGVNPASVDAACACLMGLDADRIPIVRQAFKCRHFSIAEWDWRDVRVVSNKSEWNSLLPDIPYHATFHFEPHFGWKGHVETKVGQAMANACP